MDVNHFNSDSNIKDHNISNLEHKKCSKISGTNRGTNLLSLGLGKKGEIRSI